MTDPKIRYDILANAEGEEDVARLARELEKLDDAVDPQAAARAKALAAEIDTLTGKRAAVQGFLVSFTEANAASKALESAQESLARLERRLQSIETPTRAQAGQLQKLRDEVQRAQTAFGQQTESLNRARGALDAYGISTKGLDGAQDRLTQSIKATAAEGRALVTSYQQTAQAATASAAAQTAAQRGVADSVGSIQRELGKLQQLAAVALGGSVIGQVAGDVSRTADAYNNLAARIKLVTGEGQAFNTAFQGVFEIATRTGTALEITGNLFTRIAQAGKEIGLSQRDSLALTETITKATALSGASAATAEASITQFVQGLQSGVLRGEEFNSTLEGSFRVARALADGLGVSIGELRDLAGQGAITADVALKALLGQGAVIAREFEQLPPTVGRALQNLSTQWTAYIGQADQASGASASAAKALTVLGENISSIATTLKVAGEAWLAYKALDLAGTLFRQALGMETATLATVADTAATSANTGAKLANAAATTAQTKAALTEAGATSAGTTAKVADTVATAANTKAKSANATAGAAQIGTLGRLASLGGALGLAATAVALFGDAFATAFRKVGTAIGEGAAKLAGYKDRGDEILRLQKAQEDGAKAAAAQQAEVNQRMQRGAEMAFGLTAESKKLVAEFEGMQRKGETAAAALEKLSKSLDLGDIKGISTAVVALDALGQKGALTGAQINAALGGALKGLDLATFETQAKAAFDNSAQGARRLQLVLDAIADESLKRAGMSAEELSTGFSKASTSAINDLDALDRTLVGLGKTGAEASKGLGGALDKALTAAATERAVQAVIQRMEELGRQGRLTGEDLAAGLDRALKKLDELTPGVSSLGEALRSFGLKTRAELQSTADRLGAAYRLLAYDVTVSLQDKAKAFQQYREAAIAANGGVETSEVALQRRILETRLEAADLGNTMVDAMGAARGATDQATQGMQGLISATDAADKRMAKLRNGPILGGFGPTQDGVKFGVRSAGGAANKVDGLPKIESYGDQIRSTPGGGITRTGAGQFQPPDNSGQWVFDSEKWNRSGQPVQSDMSAFWRLNPEAAAKQAALVADPARRLAEQQASEAAMYPQGGAAQRAQAPAAPAQVQMVVNIGSKQYSISATSQSAADQTIAALEAAYLAGGGG